MTFVFFISFVFILIGELADKSQLLAMVLAARYRAWQVLVGIFAATLVVHFFSAAVGQVVGGLIPTLALAWVSGLLFVGFGIWTLRGDTVDESDAERGAGRFGPILATAIAFFFAELGDKTQIMTMTLAADPGTAVLTYLRSAPQAVATFMEPIVAGAARAGAAQRFWGVTLGSTLGMVLADAFAILVGSLLGARLPEKAIGRVSGVVFIVFGALTVAAPYVSGR